MVSEKGMSRCPTGPASGAGRAIAPPQCLTSIPDASLATIAAISASGRSA
ncbi:hypothetical protein [Actinomadura formosensis]